MADSGRVGPSGQVYGLWCRVTQGTHSDSPTHRTVNWSCYWYYRWSAGPWSGCRIIAGTTAGYKYDSGGFTWPYGGSTSAQDTLYTSGSYSHAYPRKDVSYSVSVYAYLQCTYGTVQPGENITIPVLPTPAAPSDCTHTRNTDNQNTVSWTNNGNANTNPRSNNLIERSADGGGYSQIASVAGEATSYVDSTTQPDHSYAYRVRAVFTANGYSMHSGYSDTSAISYNSPAAPGTPTAARVSETVVRVTFDNSARTETATELQRSTDAKTWSTVKTVSGADVTAIDDIPPGGTFYYRVRNTRGSLESLWSTASNAVVTIIPPAAPTLTSPIGGSVINKAINPTTLAWAHNPIDGSAQTAAQIRLSVNGGTSWTSPIQITGDASSYDHPTNWEVNAQVLWQVRTKGAHNDYGLWSSSASFVVRQVPQVSIVSPADDNTVIDSMPIAFVWDYSDQSGTQRSANLWLFDENNKELWHQSLVGSQTSYSLEATDFLPDNNATLSLQLAVTSTSTLGNQTSRQFSTGYREPAAPVGTATVDPSRASVSLLVLKGDATDVPETVSLSIIRRHADGRQVTLADQVPSGTSINDPYCPIEQDITYIFVAHTESGAVSRTEVPIRLYGEMCYWITYGSKTCAVILDSTNSRETEHDYEMFSTAGNDYPMIFYGSAKQMTGSFSGTSVRSKKGLFAGDDWPVEISDFDSLAAHIGAVVIRMPHWDAFVADAIVSQSASERALERVSVAWRRVRNHGLAV